MVNDSAADEVRQKNLQKGLAVPLVDELPMAETEDSDSSHQQERDISSLKEGVQRDINHNHRPNVSFMNIFIKKTLLCQWIVNIGCHEQPSFFCSWLVALATVEPLEIFQKLNKR